IPMTVVFGARHEGSAFDHLDSSRRTSFPDRYAKAKSWQSRAASRLAFIALLVCLEFSAAGRALAQHLGIYHWAGAVDSLPRANPAFDLFGADTIRIFLGGKYDYLQRENAPNRFPGLS